MAVTTVEMAGGYPVTREADVALRDGSTGHVRPIRADDEAALLELLQGLSPDDRLLRFFSLGNNLEGAAREEAHVDYVRSYGLVVTVGPDQRIVGHAQYAPTGEGRAEVAFTISREYQGQGLASMLLGQLAEAGASNGIHTFEAVAKPENRRAARFTRSIRARPTCAVSNAFDRWAMCPRKWTWRSSRCPPPRL